ncbi:MAG: GAF domain-containing protein [Chloroflexi bacterium]|nr:GAF domain-containing protein [Chloroflexota bacterium]MBP8058455.1 GAF domain-containing protein [Chloroflexota bacterium]
MSGQSETTNILTTPQPQEVATLAYLPVPHAAPGDRPVWHVRLEVLTERNQQLGLAINDEIILGRDPHQENVVDLTSYGAAAYGVSRYHLVIRPTHTHLFALELGSTNGSQRNGRSLGVNTPYALNNGDVLSLGKLQLVLHIVSRPHSRATREEKETDLAEAISQIAQAITSQLDPDAVLSQVAVSAMSLAAAGEASIWLVDENSGDLEMVAGFGLQDEKLRHLRLSTSEETLAGQVLKNGKALRASHKPGEDQIKVKTGYLVEALMYVPLTLGGITFGVLSVVHREIGKQFTDRDERLLRAIADFAAIAIQNARLYQATDQALERRVQELRALNEVARTVSASLNLSDVYKVLVEQVNKHWPVELVRLYLLDEKDQMLVPLFDVNATSSAEPVSIFASFVADILKTGQVFVTNDPSQDLANKINTKEFQGLQPRSFAITPLKIQNRLVGALILVNKVAGTFTEEDTRLLEAFAHPIATAMENARLYAEAERQRLAIQLTAQIFSQPLLILDEQGTILIANDAANQILQTNMAQLFEGISTGLGRTAEIIIGMQTYLCTSEHLVDVGTIVVMQNITYVKQLEKDRAEFMHALSHDMKSPLTSIMGWAQLLRQVIPMEDRGKQYLDKMIAAANRMLDMITQMLQAGTGEEGIQILKKRCDLQEVINHTLADIEGAAAHKNIQVVYQQSGHPYHILADENRLYHMLLNLVDNAIKYSPNSTKVYLRIYYGLDSLSLQVQDEGPGIPENDLLRIFDKYYRSAKTSKQPGAGLGLSVVQAIVEAHEGRIVASNHPISGARFTVTLPATLRLPDEED